MVILMIGFGPLCGWLPPPSPHDSAEKIAAMYEDRTNLIRLGLICFMLAGALLGPFVAAISAQMRRIEGGGGVLGHTQLGMGMLGVLLFILPSFLMQAAAFRPGRDPQLTQLLNDAAFLPFIGAFGPAVIQNISIALAAFKDTEQRVFPRWLGYYNIWVALLFLPAALMYFFKTGPFAWDGVFVFWLPLTVFGSWFFVMFWVVRKAILTEGEDPVPGAPALPVPDAVAAA
jgi:hypothetical protein